MYCSEKKWQEFNEIIQDTIDLKYNLFKDSYMLTSIDYNYRKYIEWQKFFEYLLDIKETL